MKILTRPHSHLILILSCVFLAGCELKISDRNMTYKASPNFNVTEGHFENTDGTANEKSLTDLAGLARAYFSRPDDPNEVSGFQMLNPNNQPESARQVIWIGQSTLLVSIDGMHILTDPVFSDRASPFSFAGPKRVVPPALTAEQMPKLTAILISHNHYDHLDLPSLTELADLQPETLFLVPLGLKSLLNNNGINNVVELTGIFPFDLVLDDKVKQRLDYLKVPPLGEFDKDLQVCWFIPREVIPKKTRNGKQFWIINAIDETCQITNIKCWNVRNTDQVHINRPYVSRLDYDSQWGFSTRSVKHNFKLVG